MALRSGETIVLVYDVATVGLAGAYDSADPTPQLRSNQQSEGGVLLQATITTGGKYIYVKVSKSETVPSAATDYGIRLSNNESVFLNVSNLSQIFAWTDDSDTATSLRVTYFN